MEYKASGHEAVKKRAHMLASKKKKAAAGGDVGKHNNGKTTGFSAVTRAARKEGYSPAVAQKIAGAEYQHMKSKGMM